MAFDISQFSQNLNDAGYLLTNKYDILTTAPNTLSTILDQQTINNALELMPMRAEACNIPGVTLDTISSRRYGVGMEIKFPINVNFTDCYVTFLDDRYNTLYDYFYAWQSLCSDFSGLENGTTQNVATHTVGYQQDITADFNINIYNPEGGWINEVTLQRAWPVFTNNIQLSWSDNNTLFRTTVGFSYTKLIKSK